MDVFVGSVGIVSVVGNTAGSVRLTRADVNGPAAGAGRHLLIVGPQVVILNV